jgi:signal transduction histidine kinase/putative methionine-R-sulfoxide reductase with GAF domain
MTSATRIGTTGVIGILRGAVQRLALRVFFWLRLEGEARTLSAGLRNRISECLDGLLRSLAARDFFPTAHFLAREKNRVVELGLEERLLQTIALLDACERTLEEGIKAAAGAGEEAERLLRYLTSVAHQARRHWLHLCARQLPPTSREDSAVVNLLASLSQALETAKDLDELVEQLFTSLQDLIPHEDAQLLLLGPKQESHLVRCANSQLFVGHGGAVDSYSKWVAFQQTPLLIPDLETEPDEPDKPAYRSYVGVPLLQGEILVGTLALVSSTPDNYGQSDLDILIALAPLLGNALQRIVPEVGPLEELHRRLEEQNIILTFGREMNAALEEGRIFSLLLFKAIELTDSDAGIILTVDTERQECTIEALVGYATDMTAADTIVAARSISWDVGISGQVARTGEPALVNDVREAQEYLSVRPETLSQLTVPIKWQGEVVAVLNLESANLNTYAEKHLHVAETLAAHAAVAIGTTRLFNEVQEKREWLAGLVSNLPEGIVVTDEDLRVVMDNPAATHFLALDQPLSIGVRLEEHLLNQLEPFLEEPEALERFLEHVHSLQGGLAECWLSFKEEGKRLWLVGAPLWGESGRPTGKVILIRDARQDEESDREKLGFISVVSHELRSPLTSILGYSELLLSRNFGYALQREFLEVIFRQADHLSRLVEDLLNVSRLRRGRLKMNWSISSFQQIVAGLASQLDAQMTEKHSLLVDLPDEMPALHVDRDKMRVILNNLVNNAVKYSPDGGEVILKAEVITDRVQSHRLTAPIELPFLLVRVEDQGIGIPEHEIGQVFERFYRVDSTATRPIGGTGLGLTITKALVELHGGTIWVKSRVGEGTTFFYTLPIRDHPPEESEQGRQTPPVSPGRE